MMTLKRAQYWMDRVNKIPMKKDTTPWYKFSSQTELQKIWDANNKLFRLQIKVAIKLKDAENKRHRYIHGDDSCENY